MKQHEGKRLREWISAKKITVVDLAKRLNVTESAIFYYYNKEKVSDSFKHKLTTAGYNVFEGKTVVDSSPISHNSSINQKTNNNNNEETVNNIPAEHNLIWVPLKVQGGFLKGYANRVFMDQLEYSTFPNIKGRCWGFEVEGFSMVTNDDTSLKPGDYVITTEIPDETWLHKGKTYVFVSVDGMCVKIFGGIKDDKYILKSANPDYPPVEIPVKDVKKIFFREGKYSKG